MATKNIFKLIEENKWPLVKKRIIDASAFQLQQLENKISPSFSIIQHAIGHNKHDIVRILLKKKDYISMTMLLQYFTLAIHVHYNSIGKLILNEIPRQMINGLFKFGPLLHKAVWADNLEMVKLLIKKGADINLKSPQRETPLQIAVQFGNHRMAKFLVSQPKIRMNVHSLPDGWTPLWFAVQNLDDKMIKILLKNGANVNSTNYQGQNMLGSHIILHAPNYRQLFIEKFDMNVNQIGIYNRNMVSSILQTIKGKNYPANVTDADVFSYLKDVLPRIDSLVLNSLDFWGYSTLYYLMEGGWWVDLIPTLEKNEWDIFQTNITGDSVYDLARQQFDKEVFSMFISFVTKSYLNREKSCRSTNEQSIIRTLRKKKVTVPPGATKQQLCFILTKHQIESQKKSYPGTHSLDIISKIDIIIKPQQNFTPTVWIGINEWEYLFYKYMTKRYSRFLNDHLPPRALFAKKITHVPKELGVPFNVQKIRFMFLWVAIKGKYKLFPPTHINKKSFDRKNLKPFSLFYLNLDPRSGHTSHQNSIIIHHYDKTIERYEPHGYKASHYYSAKGLDYALQKYFKTVLPGYRFLRVKHMYPRTGVQVYENDQNFSNDAALIFNDGYCAVWSLWYFDILMKNWEIVESLKSRKMFLSMVMAKIHMKFSGAKKYILTYIHQTGIHKKILNIVNQIPELKRANNNPEDSLLTPYTDAYHQDYMVRLLGAVWSAKF